MSRNRKPTQRLLESVEQNKPAKKVIKKQKQQQVLPKKIAVAQQKLVEEAKKPDTNYNADKELQIIRDTTNKDLYKGLKVDLKDPITIQIRQILNEFSDGFLPPIFKGIIPLYIEEQPIIIKKQILQSELLKGTYETATSKSDKGSNGSAKKLQSLFSVAKAYIGKYDKDDLTDFVLNHREIFLAILKVAVERNQSFSTMKGYINNMMRVLTLALGGKTSPTYTKYASLNKDLMANATKLDYTNTLNDNEKTRWLDWEVIKGKLQRLYNTFYNINNKKSKGAYDANLNLVLLSLYTLTPPLRREIFSLQFKQDGDTIKEDYIHIRRNDVKLELNLNKKRHGDIIIDCNKELADILRQSYELYPRKYVFSNISKYPDLNVKVSPDTVANRLQNLFIDTGKNIGPSILRASFVTNRFNTAKERTGKELNMAEIKEMARLMRSSHTYLLTSYRKIFVEPKPAVTNINNSPQNTPILANIMRAGVAKRPLAITEPVNQKLTTKKTDAYTNHNAYMVAKYNTDETHKKHMLEQQKEYRAKIGNFELQKRKIVSMLKNSPVYRSKVTEATLAKYNLKIEDYASYK